MVECSLQTSDYAFVYERQTEPPEVLSLFDAVEWETLLKKFNPDSSDGDCPPSFYISDRIERLHVWADTEGVWNVLYAYPLIKNILWLIPFETEREYRQVFTKLSDVREIVESFVTGDRLKVRARLADPES